MRALSSPLRSTAAFVAPLLIAAANEPGVLSHACTECTSDGPPSCPDPRRPACHMSGPLAGACTECTAINTSRCSGARPVCNSDEGVCVMCLDNSHCPESAPACNPVTHLCVPCSGDGPPSCVDPSQPACHTSGAKAGACTECSPTNTNRCTTTRPVCLLEEGICVACLIHADCGGGTACCNTATHTCVPCGEERAPRACFPEEVYR